MKSSAMCLPLPHYAYCVMRGTESGAVWYQGCQAGSGPRPRTRAGTARRNQIQKHTVVVQFVPGKRCLDFDFFSGHRRMSGAGIQVTLLSSRTCSVLTSAMLLPARWVGLYSFNPTTLVWVPPHSVSSYTISGTKIATTNRMSDTESCAIPLY
eukprot:187939-Rhodomonas_salina.1